MQYNKKQKTIRPQTTQPRLTLVSASNTASDRPMVMMRTATWIAGYCMRCVEATFSRVDWVGMVDLIDQHFGVPARSWLSRWWSLRVGCARRSGFAAFLGLLLSSLFQLMLVALALIVVHAHSSWLESCHSGCLERTGLVSSQWQTSTFIQVKSVLYIPLLLF